jgi:hypothetical protein
LGKISSRQELSKQKEALIPENPDKITMPRFESVKGGKLFVRPPRGKPYFFLPFLMIKFVEIKGGITRR